MSLVPRSQVRGACTLSHTPESLQPQAVGAPSSLPPSHPGQYPLPPIPLRTPLPPTFLSPGDSALSLWAHGWKGHVCLTSRLLSRDRSRWWGAMSQVVSGGQRGALTPHLQHLLRSLPGCCGGRQTGTSAGREGSGGVTNGRGRGEVLLLEVQLLQRDLGSRRVSRWTPGGGAQGQLSILGGVPAVIVTAHPSGDRCFSWSHFFC